MGKAQSSKPDCRVGLSVAELVRFTDALSALDQTLSGEAALSNPSGFSEFSVRVTLAAGKGHLDGIVREPGVIYVSATSSRTRRSWPRRWLSSTPLSESSRSELRMPGVAMSNDRELRRATKSPRSLQPEESAALLTVLNYADFEGRDALLNQVDATRVVGFCGCGCATVDLAVDAAPSTTGMAHPIPNEAVVLDTDGDAIGGVLVFVRDGYLASLEVYDFGGVPISPFPPADRLRLEPTGT